MFIPFVTRILAFVRRRRTHTTPPAPSPRFYPIHTASPSAPANKQAPNDKL